MKTIKRIIIFILILTVIAGALTAYFKFRPTINVKYSLSALTDKEYYLTAHRGLSSIAPENTGVALAEAGKAGYYAAEFDIMPTKDGVWVLMHDDTLDRTTDGEGEVSSYTYSELLEFNIDSGNGIEKYPDLKITTLEEALDICEEYSMRAMIEIKGGEAEDMPAVLEIVKAHNLKNEPLIIDFNSERVEALRKADSEIELWYLVSSIDTEDIDFAKANSTALAFNFGKIRNYTMLDEAKDAGIKLAAWTVDWLPIMDILTAFDVKYITTNRILP